MSSLAVGDIYKRVLPSGLVIYSQCAWGKDEAIYKTNDPKYDEHFKGQLKLAESGNADAQYSMACHITNDYKQSTMWLRKAADQNHRYAQFELGLKFQEGEGVVQDYNQAAIWYRKAAEQGLSWAQVNLGEMYQNGQGLVQDYKQAAAWYRKAAEQGLGAAQLQLGNLFYLGQGVIQDYNQAVVLYHKAAEQGLPSAKYNLGLMYHYGQGVPQNYIEAHKWFNLAGSQGNSESIKLRGLTERRMTTSQVNEAQKRATEWQIKFDNQPSKLEVIQVK